MRETPRPRTGSTPSTAPSGGRSWIFLLLLLGSAAVVLLAVRPRKSVNADAGAGGEGAGGEVGRVVEAPGGAARDRAIGGLRRSRTGQDGGLSPAAVVANRLTTFSQSRREIAHELARRAGTEVPAEVERFFAAVQAGDWAEIKGLYNTLSARHTAAETAKGMASFWPAVVEAYGAATVATTWPPGELLAYGESVLNSLRPGTVYFSGTEAGRYVPALVGNGGGASPLIVTPDSFSDPVQLEYLAMLNPTEFGRLNREEIDRVLKRNEAPVDAGSTPGVDPKSVRAGVLKALLESNPGTTFAVDGSFDLGELAADVVPVGPILEVRPGAGGGGGTMPASRAADTAEYWRATAQRLQGESTLETDAFTRREYAQMAIIQGNVLAAQNLGAEAERTFRSALEIAPAEYEPLERLTLFLAAQGRQQEANEAIEAFSRSSQGYVNLVKDLQRRVAATPPPGR